MLFLLFVVLVVVVIFYYRSKNKYLEAHPEKIKKYQCSICRQEFEKVTKLSDGAICESCATVGDDDWKVQIYDLDTTRKYKQITCDEIRKALSGLAEKKQMLASFSETRTSESGRIVVDDNLGVFYIKRGARPIVLYKISDILDFYLEYDYEDTSSFDEASSYSVASGHVTIKVRELFNIVEITANVASKMLGQRGEVKDTFESDLAFLEQLTGRKRSPIPNKVKII